MHINIEFDRSEFNELQDAFKIKDEQALRQQLIDSARKRLELTKNDSVEVVIHEDEV